MNENINPTTKYACDSDLKGVSKCKKITYVIHFF